MIKKIKENLTAKDYAQNHLNMEVINNRTYSIESGKNKTCLQFFDDGGFFDYKTGDHGDVIDLCCSYHHINKSEAIRKLSDLLNIKHKPNNEWLQYMNWQMNNIKKWHEALINREYLYSRGLTDKTINQNMIGLNENGIVIPYQKNNFCPYFITRSIVGKQYRKQKRDSYNEHIPWGFHTLNRNQDILHITEGAFDALTLDQEGKSILSPITGHFSSDQIKSVLQKMKLFKKVVISFDGDDAGSAFTKKLAKILFKNHINFDCCILPDRMDVNDWYMKHGNIDFEVTNGLEYLGQIFESAKDFEFFVMDIARFKSKVDMETLITKSPHSSKQLLKMATTTPSHNFIAKTVSEKYKVRYSGGGVYYTYKNNFWNQVGQDEVREYIAKELANYTTGALISSVETVLRANVFKPIRYNEKRLWGFKNGTLELDTEKFRKHREDDNITFLAPFNYDATASCHSWEEFLEEVMDGADEKISLLQEFSGYIFYPNNKEFQVCLILLGEKSANGKSTFIDVIQGLVTDDINTNGHLVSSLEIAEFDEQFRRIELKDSILNLSSEITPERGNGETYFKKVMDGSIINGCRKGTQSINFVSRSKSIFACNTMPKFQEANNASSRRIMFVDFTQEFVLEPKGADQRKIKYNLSKELNKNMPGVFNWAYNGYKLLRNAKTFTDTSEQQLLKSKLKNQVHNAFIFFEDEILSMSGEVAGKAMYGAYKNWCEENTHRPCSHTKFTQYIKSKIRGNNNIKYDDKLREYSFYL